MSSLQVQPSTGAEATGNAPRATSESGFASGCLLLAIVVLLPAALYFGVFGVLLLDAFVLRTKFVSRENLSQEVIYGLEIVYAPLIYVVRASTGG